MQLKILQDQIQNCQKCPLHLQIPAPLNPITGVQLSQIIPPIRSTNHVDIMLVVDPINDPILQQPISYEHALILNKICVSIGLDPSLIYITNIIKCPSACKKQDFISCFPNITTELSYINPRVVLTCGEKVVKWFYKLSQRDSIQLPSIHRLLNNKQGRERLQNILKAYNA